MKITRKHETPTRVGGVLGGGAGLATGPVVVGAMDMEARIEESMRATETLRKKQLTADADALERDAREVSG